jgi:TRAP-type mannitol/chloroaromatic compound transport system substrate-binding protein
MEDKGIKIIGYMDSGSRNFFTQKAVRTPDDLKGQKIRVMASPVMVNTMKALGATGVPVAWAELYTALQTGVVDGAENLDMQNGGPSAATPTFDSIAEFRFISNTASAEYSHGTAQLIAVTRSGNPPVRN